MTQKTEMCLFKVAIKKSYRDSLLTILSDINSIHIKPKIKSKVESQLKEKDPLLEKIKNQRQNFNELMKKLKIYDSDLLELNIKKSERIQFDVKDLKDLINHTLEEVNYFLNRVYELERYIARAKIEFENIVLMKLCCNFISQNLNLTRDNIGVFNQLTFKVYTSFVKNLDNLVNLFDFSEFPNLYQTFNITDERIIFFIIYPKDREEDFQERIRIIHAEELSILKKYLTHEGINFERILKEMVIIDKTLSKYEKELKRIRNDNLLMFAAINEVIQNIEEYNWAERQFDEFSSDLIALSFFAPSYMKQDVKRKIIKNFEGQVNIDTHDIKKKQLFKVPTKLKSVKDSNGLKKDLKETKIISKGSKEIKKRIEENGVLREGKISKGGESGEPKEEDMQKEAPTIMKNNRLFRPYETLTKMYGVPAYAEIDPTPILFFTFPLIFGLMFGDIGHGLCLVISGLIGARIYKEKEGSRNFSWIIFYCGLGAILFGFLYGEFFGMHNIEIFGVVLLELKAVTFYVPLLGNITLHNPIENIMSLFYFSIIVGVIHINLGWFVQLLNYWKQSRRYLAITDSFFKILLLTGGTTLIFGYGFQINLWIAWPYPILLTVIPGLSLVVSKPLGKALGISYLKEETFGGLLSEGSIETFETLLSVLSNVSSYIRLLALALAHISLMLAIRTMIDIIVVPSPNENLLLFIIAEIFVVIGLIFGNLIIILIEGLLVFLNTLRLHFYEFFFKFYQGSGTEFFPFYLDNDYSVINFKVKEKRDFIFEEIEKQMDVKESNEVERARNYISNKFL